MTRLNVTCLTLLILVGCFALCLVVTVAEPGDQDTAKLYEKQTLIAQWTKQMLAGEASGQSNLIACANDTQESDLLREMALRSLAARPSPTNIVVITSFLRSDSDKLRTAAYYSLPKRIKKEISFDYTKKPDAKTYSNVVNKVLMLSTNSPEKK